MIVPQDSTSLKDMIAKAQTIYVLLNTDPSYDALACALSLYLSLKELGKQVQIASAAPMRVEASHLVGIDEVKQKIGNRNLLVSFEYEENSVDKVHYTMSEDGKRFNLIISPKSGTKPLDPAKVEYGYTGAEADLVFIVGASSFEDLGMLYESERSLYDTSFTVSITPSPIVPFAQMTLETSGQSSMTEGIAVLLRSLGIEIKDDIATNILSAIEYATQRFQSLTVTADTFEIVAELMRNGARRSSLANPAFAPPSHSVPSATSVPPQSFAQMLRSRSQGRPAPLQMPPQSMQPNTTQNLSTQPTVQEYEGSVQSSTVHNPQQIYQIQRTDNSPHSDASSPTTIENPPEDWIKPKVYTGNTRV